MAEKPDQTSYEKFFEWLRLAAKVARFNLKEIKDVTAQGFDSEKIVEVLAQGFDSCAVPPPILLLTGTGAARTPISTT